jgi:hypothetical protein
MLRRKQCQYLNESIWTNALRDIDADNPQHTISEEMKHFQDL